MFSPILQDECSFSTSKFGKQGPARIVEILENSDTSYSHEKVWGVCFQGIVNRRNGQEVQ